ncbi:MAG: ATP-binding protein, partial [Desulfobacterales bacterium]|nr:ATP-binding protein [Desulfobacterales bacterium]
AGGFALIMSLGMARRLSRPLRALSRAAQQLKDGDLTQQVEPEGKDEIGQLGRVFNHLAKSLQRQEQFRRKLTSDLAHELRTPLTNLQTHIEALLDGVLTPTQENLSSIHEEILRLGRLVSSLEKLTRAEAGVLNLKREHRDLRELVEKMTCQFQPLFIDKGVKLTISLPRGPVDISLDADKISQVIGNLLSNALKFTPQGGEVEVAARKGDREVRISVKDSGAGIPERDIPFIFERFFRGEDGNGGGSNGSGIGLTIVRELTEAHGGKIDVKSQRNRGAEFTIRLPLPL